MGSIILIGTRKIVRFICTSSHCWSIVWLTLYWLINGQQSVNNGPCCWHDCRLTIDPLLNDHRLLVGRQLIDSQSASVDRGLPINTWSGRQPILNPTHLQDREMVHTFIHRGFSPQTALPIVCPPIFLNCSNSFVMRSTLSNIKLSEFCQKHKWSVSRGKTYMQKKNIRCSRTVTRSVSKYYLIIE